MTTGGTMATAKKTTAPVEQAAAAKAPTRTAAEAPAKTPAKAAARTPAKAAAKAPAKTAARTAAKAPAKTAGRAPARAAAQAPAVAVAPQDDWTSEELDEIRQELDAQALALRAEIDRAEAASESLKRDQSSEGSGDEADAGSKTFEREHEMSLSNNSRDLLVQVERALGRLDAGTYGRCEECGNPIPKARLQAFPRATLCVACKQREERR